MSLKKNKKINIQLKFIKLAFEQAKINLGSTGSNPSVGCIVTKNNSVISSGYTSINGRPHAEYNALNKKINFKNSNIYTTLEPCSHYGLTAPCTNLIIKKKIKRVFFSVLDKDRRSANKSKKKFDNFNIRTKTNILKYYGDSFYKDYYLNHNSSYPLIDAKIAISKDYFTINKKKKWITNKYSRKLVHFLRSRYNCIISTSKSINKDNSLLNCRLEGLEKKSPALVIIDRNFSLKKTLNIIKVKKRKIYLFTNKINKTKANYFKKKGVKIIYLKKMLDKDDYIILFKKIKLLGFSRIFVESGLSFLNFLVLNKFINNIYIFKSDIKFKRNGINFATNKIIKKIKLNQRVRVNLFNDSLYCKNLK